MTLGEIIKDYRTENRMSMEEFARKAGKSKQYISILERNYNPSSKRPPVPTMDTILAVSDAMGRNFDEIFFMLDRDQKIKLPTIPDEELLNDELISRLCQLTPEEMQRVDAFVQGILATRRGYTSP